MILASFGLGSFTMSMWFARYRWLFLVATIILLGFAYYSTYKNKKNNGPWSFRILHGTTALSLGLVIYTLLIR
ncbi:MAG TPA: hypothetical protein ENK33_11380 [Desulfobacterales bacterium]|nr:hypothetical protein [Desulfobacterales bacterium]